MPNRLKKRCAYRGCPKTTTDRFCDEHQALAQRFTDQRRGSAKQRGYDANWRRVAERRRDLDGGLCQECLKHELLTPSNIVDHIIPIHVRPEWRLEIDNTQVLCPTCHQKKTASDTKRYGTVTHRDALQRAMCEMVSGYDLPRRDRGERFSRVPEAQYHGRPNA